MAINDAVERYRHVNHTLSELAHDTGLAIEEIMEAVGDQNQTAAIQMFLASCRTVAETQDNPEFLKIGQEAVKSLGIDPGSTAS